MPITNFPFGVSSFGSPVLGINSGLLWVSPNANVWYVNPGATNSGIGNASDGFPGTDPSQPFATLGKAASVAKNGDWIFIGAGNINENVTFTQRYLRVIGAGVDATYIKPDAATTKIVTTPLGETASTSTGIVSTGRGCIFTNFSIQASGTGCIGMYVGDGGRVTASPALAVGNPNSTLITNVHFDGNGVGEWAICLDGMGPGTRVTNCHFDNWNSGVGGVGGNVIYCSGLNKDQVGAVIDNNFCKGTKGIFIKRANSSVAYGNIIKNNAFADTSTLAATEAVSLGTGGGPDSIEGNWFGCTNTFTALATDFQSGNFKTAAGNSATFVSQS